MVAGGAGIRRLLRLGAIGPSMAAHQTPGVLHEERRRICRIPCPVAERENVSPALSWKKAPKGTKSFALLVHDPDAPTGGAGWWHWLVYNLPADTTSLAQGAGSADGAKLPAGAVQQKTDFGAPGWGGPCPPTGDKPHRYVFTLHALKVDKLEIPEGATASLVGYMVNANSIGKASFTAKYGRKK
jgi:Raf kinase inhibitor-like YbhB/YbcL family protein